MDLQPTEEHLAVAELTRAIGLDVLAPAARTAEEERAVPDDVWRTLVDTGLTMPLSEELGGGGIPDTVTQMIAIENLAYGDPGLTMAALWGGAPALLLSRHGSPEQTAGLARLSEDPKARGAVALYEGYGRGPEDFTTTISTAPDGTVRVKGRKVAVAFAETADPLIVVGRDADTGALRASLVPVSAAGVSVRGTTPGLALDAAALATVSFDVTLAAAAAIDGEELAGTVHRLRLALAAAQVGTATRAVEYASAYATERVAFGKPIAGFQGVSFPLAEALMRIYEVRAEVFEAAVLVDAERYTEAAPAVTRAVNYASEVAAEATRTAVQTLGGHGFIDEHPVEQWYRSAAALSAIDFDPLRSAFTPAL
ncbi:MULTISPECIES: acyl-CoA dehydrogenase family protein [Streptomyces]|nr:acyl-CoA dehydrogenase family protein [Streptomyces ureilyticus]WSZ19094.1 acyl-CoA/acyl-ACP dehydrogenase [Streptomyces canus]WSZ29531.1 acyl-CoA/acyl-ACP dehydrogenase [Streptomyces sp. NBC_00882]WSZ63606.1 acyl-CoA/acyl-ACP dehydrogenase [Streptomyces canus]